MSNYTVTTNFGAKDGLPSGNPAKLILGAQLTTEFVNIATAIATKLDSSGGAFVSSIAGTANQVAASASTGAVTLSLPQNVVIPTPASGNALTLAAFGSGSAISATGGSSAAPVFAALSSAGVALSCWSLAQTGQVSWQGYQPASSNDFRLNAGGSDRFILTSAGNLTLPAPSSGTALTVTGVAAANVAVLGGVTIATAGNVTIGAPTAGTTVTAAAFSSGSAFVGTGGAASAPVFQANGAAAVALSMIALSQSGQTPWQLYQPASSNDLRFNAGGGDRVIFGVGVQIGAPTGGDQGAGTLNATGLFINGVAVGTGATGTFTGTFTGGTTAPTVTCFYSKIGTAVTVRIKSGASFVSNANSFTITGLPAAIQPTTGGVFTNATLAEDNGVPLKSAIGQVSGGTLTLFLASAVGVYSSSGWTASGTKALSDTAFTWDVN